MTREELYEQRAYFPTPARRQARADTATRRQVITDDARFPDDDVLYETRSPSSVRRYHQPIQAPPLTEIRVTRHQGIPPRRASQEKQQQHTPQPQTRPHRRRSPWFYVGVGMIAMLLLYYAIEEASTIAQRMSDNAHYGYPRTYQCDANVKHGGVSHFIVENLHGHVFVLEIPAGNLSKTFIYTGPVLAGTDADLIPATVTFQDINGDGLPDMILKVAGTAQVTIYINTGQGFRPATANDHIKLGEVQQ